MPATRTNSPAAYTTPLHVVTTIIGISVVASAFLMWLVFEHRPTDISHSHLAFLPALNAILNAACTVALVIAFRHIWNGRIIEHRNAMFAAFFFSSLFLASYITNYALHGESHFPTTHPTARFIYLWVLLVPHILVSIVALPMILVTFFFSLSGRIPLHRRIARYTFPIWLYVSVSGVFVYAMLAYYH
jgi:putative membrane protein